MQLCRITVVFFFVAAACLAAGQKPVSIPSGQSDFQPEEKVRYSLGDRCCLYRPDPNTHAGPASVVMSTAWVYANEFVYRTALRKKCGLPATIVALEDGRIRVAFYDDKRREVLSVFVLPGEHLIVEFAYRKNA